MGASRRQILRSVMLEALIIGLGASIVGLFAGHRRREGHHRAVQGLQIDLPSQGTVLLPRTVIVSLLVGTIVTVVAGALPGAPRDPRAADRGAAPGRHADAAAPAGGAR